MEPLLGGSAKGETVTVYPDFRHDRPLTVRRPDGHAFTWVTVAWGRGAWGTHLISVDGQPVTDLPSEAHSRTEREARRYARETTARLRRTRDYGWCVTGEDS